MGEMKSFRSTFDPSELEATTFELCGVRTKSGDEWSETFTCLGYAPPSSIGEYGQIVSGNDRGDRTYNRIATMQFLMQILDPDDLGRFIVLMKDQDRIIDDKTLADVALYLGDGLFDRPTKRSSNSGGGSPPGDDTSPDDSGETAST